MNRQLAIYWDLEHVRDPFDPASVHELCFPSADTRALLLQWTERQGHAKNLLLYGPSGSGKTRAAEVLCRERLGQRSVEWHPIEYIPCESGTFDQALQHVKSGRQNFQKLTDSDFEQFYILDEFDNFRAAQQLQAKQVLEQTDVTFVLITNHIANIDPGVRNRCLEISWHIPSADVCLPRLRQLADRTGAGHVSDSTLVERVYTTAGWRQMLRNIDLVRSIP